MPWLSVPHSCELRCGQLTMPWSQHDHRNALRLCTHALKRWWRGTSVSRRKPPTRRGTQVQILNRGRRGGGGRTQQTGRGQAAGAGSNRITSRRKGEQTSNRGHASATVDTQSEPGPLRWPSQCRPPPPPHASKKRATTAPTPPPSLCPPSQHTRVVVLVVNEREPLPPPELFHPVRLAVRVTRARPRAVLPRAIDAADAARVGPGALQRPECRRVRRDAAATAARGGAHRHRCGGDHQRDGSAQPTAEARHRWVAAVAGMGRVDIGSGEKANDERRQQRRRPPSVVETTEQRSGAACEAWD